MIKHNLEPLHKPERPHFTTAADATISAKRVLRPITRVGTTVLVDPFRPEKVWTRSDRRALGRSNIHTSTAALRQKKSFALEIKRDDRHRKEMACD